MSTDAQRLIALSLGKIACSRGQRGGINLHKNLLVAGVLHKARTVIMIDNYNLVMQNRAKLVPNQNCQKENIQNVPKSDLNSTKNRSNELRNHSAISDSKKSCENAQSTEVKGQPNIMDTSNKENESLPMNDKVDKKCCNNGNTTVNSTCPDHRVKSDTEEANSTRGQSRCLCNVSLKRRHTETSTENNNQIGDPTVSKRTKVDTKSCGKSDNVSCVEPMQTESPQISNLVACFNTGFTGLLSHVGAADGVMSASQESPVSSCGTQHKSGFPSLSSTPVLALSV